MNRQPNHAWFDYPRWAAMNNVEHLRMVRQNDTEACRDTCGGPAAILTRPMRALPTPAHVYDCASAVLVRAAWHSRPAR